MKFEEVMQAIGAILMFFSTPILMFIIGVVGWPFIVTIGLIGGAITLVGAILAGLVDFVLSLFD